MYMTTGDGIWYHVVWGSCIAESGVITHWGVLIYKMVKLTQISDEKSDVIVIV